MRKTEVLVIDDEPNIRKLVASILEDEGYFVRTAEDGEKGLTALREKRADVVILDVWLPGMSGIDVLDALKPDLSDTSVIMISGHASIDVAVKAVKNGAFDFIEKPLSVDRIVTLVKNAVEVQNLKRENFSLKRKLVTSDDFVGEGKAMAELRKLIEQAAKSKAPVFISGENGTGKELVAREIHVRSDRGSRPFVAINCAAIPENLIESELFGHERGAFTGAVAQKQGRFELADKGSIFLDEIVDLSLSAQSKVLRAVQEQVFERVGSNSSIKVDVRIVAASNKNVHEAMLNKSFREDLFYRLHVIPIQVPPLRERREDIPVLVDYFVRRGISDFVTDQRDMPVFSAEAMKLLIDYDWPGNIRQLKNIVQRALVLANNSHIDEELISFALAGDLQAHGSSGHDVPLSAKQQIPDDLSHLELGEARDAFERRLILQKLAEHDYNVSKTAQALGIYPSNLHAKIKRFNIQVER